jgi:hypothetical protein
VTTRRLVSASNPAPKSTNLKKARQLGLFYRAQARAPALQESCGFFNLAIFGNFDDFGNHDGTLAGEGALRQSQGRLCAPKMDKPRDPTTRRAALQQEQIAATANREISGGVERSDKNKGDALFRVSLGCVLVVVYKLSDYALPALNPACSICSRAASAVE